MAEHARLELTHARVMNYGCFADSGDVPISSVTALIAENENGKTTFLRALAWWSDGAEDFDEEDRWDGAPTVGDLDLVSLTFKVPRDVATHLRNQGAKKVPSTIRIIRSSDSKYRVEGADGEAVLEFNLDISPFDEPRQALLTWLQQWPDAARDQAAIDQLDDLQVGDPKPSAILDAIYSPLAPHLPAASIEEWNTQRSAIEKGYNLVSRKPKNELDLLAPYIPALIYFDDQIDFVRDDISYQEVVDSPENAKTMINLAKLADNIDLLEVARSPLHVRQKLSRTAETTLSEGFTQYWQGEVVTVQVFLDETRMGLMIEHRGRTQRPSRRSSGLKWQLGFFVNFLAQVDGDYSGAVLLIDEPGLRLHIKQQPKLLHLFDDLAKAGCKIIYSTHLGYMLDPSKPQSYRPLVKDPTHDGATIVVPNIMSLPSKSDVMQPVRQVLGMGIADALGLGGRSVIAEGWAERYVLLAMAEECRRAKLDAISIDTTVLPAGGSGKKMLPFAALALAEKASAVLLADDDAGGRSTVKEVEKAFPNAIAVVRTHEEDAPTELELEDLISRSLFIELVNESHKDVPKFTALVDGDLDASLPVCDAVESAFTKKGLGKFQKLRPAMELQRRVEAEIPPDQETLEQFAGLFTRLNAGLEKV